MARYRFEFVMIDAGPSFGSFFADGETEQEARAAYMRARTKRGDEVHLRCVGMVPVPDPPVYPGWTWSGWTTVPCAGSPNTLGTQI